MRCAEGACERLAPTGDGRIDARPLDVVAWTAGTIGEPTLCLQDGEHLANA